MKGRPALRHAEVGRASGADPHPLSLRTGATPGALAHQNSFLAANSSGHCPRPGITARCFYWA